MESFGFSGVELLILAPVYSMKTTGFESLPSDTTQWS